MADTDWYTYGRHLTTPTWGYSCNPSKNALQGFWSAVATWSGPRPAQETHDEQQIWSARSHLLTNGAVCWPWDHAVRATDPPSSTGEHGMCGHDECPNARDPVISPCWCSLLAQQPSPPAGDVPHALFEGLHE